MEIQVLKIGWGIPWRPSAQDSAFSLQQPSPTPGRGTKMPQSWKKGNSLCYFPFYDQKAKIGFHRQFRLLVFERSILDKKSFANIYTKAIASPFLKNGSIADLQSCQSQVYSRVIQFTCVFIFRLFPIMGYYKILSTASCAIQKVLVGYVSHTVVYTLIPNFQIIYPHP